jgi:hypothetical protein
MILSMCLDLLARIVVSLSRITVAHVDTVFSHGGLTRW